MIRAIQELLSRLVAVVRRDRLDRDFDAELATHITLLIEQNRRRGMSSDEARRHAVLRIGGLAQTRDLHRESRGLPRLEHLLQAFSQGWRSWARAKGIAVVASAAIAVGIGSATAIYSVVNAAMLKPLPYPDGDRFVAVFAGDLQNAGRSSPLRSEDAERIQARHRSFEAFGWFRGAGKNLMIAGQPHHVEGVAVTVPLVQALNVAPAIGRWFEDETSVVLSHGLWRQLGGTSALLGQSVTLDGRSYVIGGVMPETFQLPVPGMTATGVSTDVWIPLDPTERAGAAYFSYGRLRPDVSAAVAAEDLRRVSADIVAEDGPNRARFTIHSVPLGETVSRGVRPTLVLLLGAAGLLFLITCANAAGLLLARSVARAPETALRVALGAGPGRLMTHYLAESLLVSLAGAAGGVLLSVALSPAIVSMAKGYVPRAEEISVDWSVLLFALAAAGLASLLSSVAPLWQALRTRPADVLDDGIRASAGTRSRAASQTLVVAEVALAFALLAAGAVLVAHVRGLARSSPGFDADNLLSFIVSIPGEVASDPSRRMPLQRRFVDALETIPGVDGVAFANSLPLRGCCWLTDIVPETGRVDADKSDRNSMMAVSEGYFRTMRIPLRQGRLFTDAPAASESAPVPVVVSESFAKRYWPDRNPIGASGRFDQADGTRFTVVGVVADVRNVGLDNASMPEIYRPAFRSRVETMRFVVRSTRDEASLMADVRRQVQRVDASQPVHSVAAMRRAVQDTMVLDRTVSRVTTFFAGSALLLAMAGVYGVVSYSVRQRTVEIGVRLAFGARRGSVFSMVVGSGLKLAAMGVVVGGAAAAGAVSYLGSVFRLGDPDLTPYVAATAIVALVAFAASLVPAWRATLVSPLAAIRDRP
jgi:predicted permease